MLNMKVLIIRNSFEHNFGGAERLAVLVGEELKKNELDPVVISRQSRLLTFADAQGIKHHKGLWWAQQNWSGVMALLFPIYLLWQLVLFFWYIGLMLRHRPDAVHAMSKDDFIAATLAGKLLGKPVFWTDPADLKHLFANHHIWYKNPVGKLVYIVSKLANVVTLVSKSEQALIEESLHHPTPANFRVVYMVGRDEIVKPIERNEKDAIIFCATSRLVVAKGIGELIDAFNQVSRENPTYRLWIVGDGPDAEQFHAQAKDNQAIEFLGHQDNPLQYLAAADIYVHPTHHEGFSLALAEAAMLAKPIIATNVGGNPELVGDKNGLLVPIKDATALAAAMRQLAGDASDRATMGEHARDDFVDKFDLAKVIKEEIIPLYEQKTA